MNEDENMSKHTRRGSQIAHSRSSSRANLNDITNPTFSGAIPAVMTAAQMNPRSTPPASPRSREVDPFLSISRAITNVKVRTGARLTALAVQQRYARNNAQNKCIQTTAKMILRLSVLVIAILLALFLFVDTNSFTGAKSSEGGKALGLSFGRGSKGSADIALQALLKHRPAEATTKHFDTGPWIIGAITDQDRESCKIQEKPDGPLHESPCGKANTWISYFKRGTFTLKRNSAKFSSDEFASAELSWLDEKQLENRGHFELDSKMHSTFGGRGMELSELEWFQGHLLTPDDHTGILFEITSPRGLLDDVTQNDFYAQSSKVPPSTLKRASLLDGPGNDTEKPFKAEWMVVKDDNLIVGGHGRSYTMPDDGTKIKSDNPKWIKIVDKDFGVQHVDWSENYDKLAKAAGVEFPGYLMHEAVIWSAERREWVFLPRRMSTEPFDPVKNENRGTNLALIASEDFEKIQAVTINGLEYESGFRGFSTAKFVPGTADQVVVAIRSVEIEANENNRGREVASFITAFELPSGKILLEEEHFSMKKFEGLVFL